MLACGKAAKVWDLCASSPSSVLVRLQHEKCEGKREHVISQTRWRWSQCVTAGACERRSSLASPNASVTIPGAITALPTTLPAELLYIATRVLTRFVSLKLYTND